MVDLTKLSALIEKVVQPFVADNIATRTALYQFTMKTPKTFPRKGLDIYVPVRVGRFSGIIGQPSGEVDLMRGEPNYKQATYSTKLITASFEITKRELSLPRTQEVVPILSRLTKDLMNDVIWDLNRQFFSDGSAQIGTANGAGTDSTSLTLSPTGGTNGDITAQDLITPGDYIKIGTGDAVQVSAVSGNTITLAAARTWNDGDAVKKVKSNGSVSNEIEGLLAIVSSGSYGGLDPSTYPAWSAYRDVPGSATTLALADLYKAYSAIQKLGDVDYLFVNKTLFNKYGSLLQAQIRFTAKENLYAGWRGLEFMGGKAAILLDHLCPDDAVFFISSKNLYRLVIQDPRFEKGTDGLLFKSYGNLKYEVVLAAILNLGVDVRGAFGIVGNRTA